MYNHLLLCRFITDLLGSAVFPLIYHSIVDEIPEGSRQLVTRLFQLWLVLAATLVLNMVACIFLLLGGSSDGGKDLGASIMYVTAALT